MPVPLAATVVLFAAALAWLAVHVLPPRRAARLRNAFRLRAGGDADFDWTPDRVPAGFRVETARPPGEIERAVAELAGNDDRSDWASACALVGMLVRHAQREGGIREELGATYRGIVGGAGYCVDYVRVFLAAARCKGLFCRQWAFAFDGFGGHGHTFVEVFDRTRARWIFLDVHNNVFAVCTGSDEPLGALELQHRLIDGPDNIEFRQAAPGRLGYPIVSKLVDYYRRGAGQWCLWWGNDVVAREQTGIARVLRPISAKWAYRCNAALGSATELVAVVTPQNVDLVRRTLALRRTFLAALSGVVGLGVLLGFQIGFGWAEK